LYCSKSQNLLEELQNELEAGVHQVSSETLDQLTEKIRQLHKMLQKHRQRVHAKNVDFACSQCDQTYCSS
jgi:ElaB/YqjD/DUF883 family membrane-anchored ribosome-binding protein